MNDLELKKLKNKYMDAVNSRVSKYIEKNTAVLDQYLEATLRHLQAKKVKEVKEFSYQLLSMAKSFGRSDITNVCEIIYKSMCSEKYSNNEDLHEVFAQSLEKLSKLQNPDQKIENEVIKDLYLAMRKANE